MVTRPQHMNAYEFVVVSALRAKQLAGRCIPRVDGDHTVVTTAQLEVASGRVAGDAESTAGPQCHWQR